MSDNPALGKKPSPELELSRTPDGDGLVSLPSNTISDTVTTPGVSDPQMEEGDPTPEVQSQRQPLDSGTKQTDGNEEMITGTRPADQVALCGGGLQSRTETQQESSTSLWAIFALVCMQVRTSVCSCWTTEEPPRDGSNEPITFTPGSPTPVAMLMTSGSSAGEEQLPHEAMTVTTSSSAECTPTASDTNFGAGNGQGEGKSPVAEVQPQHEASVSDIAIRMDDNEEMIITGIRATNVALGLRRLPAGFYITVHHSGLEWRTENKPSSANDDVVEWSSPIPIPSTPLADIRLEVYASFEFQPMLGNGEQLRNLTIKVKQLLDCSARGIPFTFFPKDSDVVSPCSSIFVAVGRQKRKSGDPPTSTVLGPFPSDIACRGELEDTTNQGHSALLHYQKYRERQELERSIEQFTRALDICPADHPGRAAAQSNLAMAKLVLCQVEDGDASFEDPLRLYGNVLGARPVSHLDRPSTLIQMAAVHLALMERRNDEAEGQQAEALLHETLELSHADSHESRAARLMLQLCVEHRVGHTQKNGGSVAEQSSISCITDEDPTIVSAQLLQHFERFGDLQDLEQAIAMLKNLTGSIPDWDARYPGILGNLGMALSRRFQCLGELRDLEEAISAGRAAIELIPDGHPDKPGRLSNLGNSFRTRFKRLGDLKDLEEAISTQRAAVELTPDDHPHKSGRLNNLANSFRTRFERFGELRDLEEAISTQRAAIELIPDGHPGKPTCLNNLCTSFRIRFECLGELKDLEEAISTQRAVVKLTPDDHPAKPGCLNNLGISLVARFERLGEVRDLEEAISTQRAAADFTPDGHPDKPGRLGNLGASLVARFERLGELRDLEEAISTGRAAIELTPDGHPDKPGRLNNLGIAFRTRFKRLGELMDLEEAISAQRAAVELTPDGRPDKLNFVGNLGNSIRTRFERLGRLRDLEEAIDTQRAAVELTPNDHPDKPGRLHSLGISFVARFERLGELGDLEEAISTGRAAVELTPDGHPDKPSCFNSLGNSLVARFERLGELRDLEEAISTQRAAVELTPDGHPDKLTFVSNLSTSFVARFEHLGELRDLEEVISAQRAVHELTPNDHPNKPGRLSNLGNSFVARFERLGELRDLKEAISAQRAAVELTPDDHPDKPVRLNNLCFSLRTRFEHLGELRDLEEAISTQSGAIELTPDGHPNKATFLDSLGISFITRFEHLRELRDLEDAVSTHRAAVELTPDQHPHKPTCLSNLGNSLRTRFERLGELTDLEDAISTQRSAVELIPDGHPDKPTCLNNLGSSFRIRFEHLGELRDLEEAISTQLAAVELTPDGHLKKFGRLNNLGISFRTRFEHLGELRDLEEAISSQRAAVELTTDGHPEKATCLNNLGNSFRTRFEHFGELSDLEDAISAYTHAASSPFGRISVRFSTSQRWISCARDTGHRSLLHAYSVAIHLLPQLAWIGLSLSQRYSQLVGGADLVREAAAAALGKGFPEMAVEWLEQGRSIVWGELFQLRSPYEELSSTYPDYALKLRELSAQLEYASADREQSLSTLLDMTQSAIHRPQQSLEQQVNRHRSLAIQRDGLLHEIRRLPGFSRFLLQKQFFQLRASAHSGPVVILNVAESRCDALVVLANANHVIHVPLPNFSSKKSVALRTTLKSLCRHGDVVKSDGATWETFLPPLWQCVVKPVLDALAFSLIPGDIPRIFWCPTGPLAFLPLHAAGFYDPEYSPPGHKVFDFVVSSYVPTLSILAPSPTPVAAPSGNLRVLLVPQPKSDGHSRLPGVATELAYVREAICNSPSACTTILESSVDGGAVEDVLTLMKEADWVHFACHGMQDAKDPPSSGLCLADQRRLKLRDIIRLSRSRGGLAFLSACQTATGDVRLSDEAVHITAGMLLAGYSGVVGTMWSIVDYLAPDVARGVYEHLFRSGTRPDHREAARALHEAIAHVRDRRNASFDEWIPFIHVGL